MRAPVAALSSVRFAWDDRGPSLVLVQGLTRGLRFGLTRARADRRIVAPETPIQLRILCSSG